MRNQILIIFLLSLAVLIETLEPSSSFVRVGIGIGPQGPSVSVRDNIRIKPLPHPHENGMIAEEDTYDPDWDSIPIQASTELLTLDSLAVKLQRNFLLEFILQAFVWKVSRSRIDRPPIVRSAF